MFNRALDAAFTGKGVTARIGANLFEILPAESAAFWRTWTQKALAGEHVKTERLYHSPVGDYWLEYRMFPLYEAGKTLGVFVSSDDMTKEWKTALALEHSEEDHRRLFNENPLPIWVVDRETFQILHVNRAICDLLGYSEAELLQKKVMDLRLEEDLPHFHREHAHLIASEGDATVQTRHRTKRGELIDVRLFSHAVTFNGRPARVSLVQDITEQLRAERELARANERFRLASEAITSVVYEMDRPTGRFVASSSFYLLTGFDPVEEPEILTLSWWASRIHADDFEHIRESIDTAYRTADRYDAEYRIQHKDGHYLYVWHRGILVKDESGEVIRVTGTVQDITQRKEMEAQVIRERNNALTAMMAAEEMNRLKSNFLANMSHEIRTPLTGILGFSQLLSESISDPVLRGFAESIETSAKRLEETLHSILDLAILESKKLVLSPSETDINVEIERICASMQPLVAHGGVELRFMPTQDIFAQLDREYFEKVISQLVHNAIKFTPEGTVVVRTETGESAQQDVTTVAGFERYTVGEHPVGERLRVIIEDTGVGIPEEALAMIFEEFKQVSTGYSRTYEGAGLGLAISSRIVMAMGGSIEVCSAQGVGSTFIVRLPMVAVG